MVVASSPITDTTLSLISLAAFFVNVKSKIDSGATPSSIIKAARRTIVAVLPEPAPAVTKDGPL